MNPQRLCLSIAAAALITLVGCGSTPTTPVSVGAPSEQAAQAKAGGQAKKGEDCGARKDGVDRSDKDGRTSDAKTVSSEMADYADVPVDESLAPYAAISVLRVTDREHPQMLPGKTNMAYRVSDAAAIAATPDSPRGPEANFHIARPITFATDRAIKGDVGPCNTLMVPGGTAKDKGGVDRAAISSMFPDKLKVGDRVLALWWSPPGAGQPSLVVATMLLADGNGVVTLPFGTDQKLNVDTYQPSAVVLRAPVSAPAVEPDVDAELIDVEAELEALLPTPPPGTSRLDLAKHAAQQIELREKLKAERAKGGTTTTVR